MFGFFFLSFKSLERYKYDTDIVIRRIASCLSCAGNGIVGLRVASLITIQLHHNIYRKIFVSDFIFVFDAIMRII